MYATTKHYYFFLFFFNDTATTEIYTLSLHDALPILPVLLIPGFLAGDPSLRTMRRWLRARNYWTCTSQIRFNVDCTRRSVEDRKSTRLNSSHANISYAVFCLKKKK